ncbi:MAG TPA: cupin domain-containing protein [Candidatus Eremiobacteraeota bacterium]|nr:MAG: Cupin domain protein [bacterium ADurb.Bin363]HPZ06769.1 cupin domain-containing protein [Candidatus Eremiobacteraeota bacterium]
MYIKNLNTCKEITSGDNCRLREILNPLRDGLSVGYSLAHASVGPGETTFKHTLTSSEVYYILSGEGIMYIDNEEQTVLEDFTIYIPPGSLQCIKNTGTEELIFLCIVDPPWKAEDEVIKENI